MYYREKINLFVDINYSSSSVIRKVFNNDDYDDI